MRAVVRAHLGVLRRHESEDDHLTQRKMFQWAEVTGTFCIIFQLDEMISADVRKARRENAYVVGINIKVIEQLECDSAIPTL